ncbi:hypothetical protein MTO96_031598 [Rhipicephalus appendiculatus]
MLRLSSSRFSFLVHVPLVYELEPWASAAEYGCRITPGETAFPSPPEASRYLPARPASATGRSFVYSDERTAEADNLLRAGGMIA